MSSADQILLFEGLEEAAEETTQEPAEGAAAAAAEEEILAYFRLTRSSEKKIALGVLAAMRELVGRGLNILHEFAEPFLADEGFTFDASKHVALIVPQEGGELAVVVVEDPGAAQEVLAARRAAGLTP